MAPDLTPAAYAREAERLRFMAKRARATGDANGAATARRLDRQCLAMLRRAEG